MPFGSELNISPAQVLAAEAENKRREQEAVQFAAKMQDLAQARAAEREAALASGAWERQKWGVEQGWKGKEATWREGEPGRKEAFEVFKKGLEPWEPKTQAEQAAWLMEKGGIEAAVAGRWGTEGGIQTQTVTGEQKLAPVVKGMRPDPSDPRYQIDETGQRHLIATPTEKPEVWWEDPSRPGWQISNRGGERVRQETSAEKGQYAQKQFDLVEAKIAEKAKEYGFVATGIDKDGHTTYGPAETPLPPGFIPESATVGRVRYGAPKPEKPLTPTWGERNKIMKELSTLIDDGTIGDSATLTTYIESQGLKADDPAFVPLYKRIPTQTPEKSFWSSRLGEAIKPGRAKKPTLSGQYQSGETRTIGEVTYKRNAQGQWLPVS